MIKRCIILILATHVLLETWVLFGTRTGNSLATFWDGQTHGVIVWWYVKGLMNQVLDIVYCFVTSMVTMKYIRKLAFFFWVLTIYHAANLLVWCYNYSTNRYVFYVMLVVLIGWVLRSCWPRGAKVVKMKGVD